MNPSCETRQSTMAIGTTREVATGRTIAEVDQEGAVEAAEVTTPEATTATMRVVSMLTSAKAL